MNDRPTSEIEEQALQQALSDYRAICITIAKTQQALFEAREVLLKNKRLTSDLIEQLSGGEREEYRRCLDAAEKSGLVVEDPIRGERSMYAATLQIRLQRIAKARSSVLIAQTELREFIQKRDSLRRIANGLAEEIGGDRIQPFGPQLHDMNHSTAPVELAQIAYQEVIDVISGNDTQRDWKANEIANQLPGVDRKRVYNALQWGIQTGRLIRVSHGRYRHSDVGFGIETAADIGAPEQDDN